MGKLFSGDLVINASRRRNMTKLLFRKRLAASASAKTLSPVFLGLLLAFLLVACSDVPINHYAKETPSFNPLEFFPGNTRAWGIVQDWRGRVIRRFEVDITGSVANGELTLDEDFVYSDGERSNRVWTIRVDESGNVSGLASDIETPASGAIAGNAMNWRYSMNLPVDDTTYFVSFDDWLWQLDSQTLFNSAKIRKFGFTVAEVTIFMQKASAETEAD